MTKPYGNRVREFRKTLGLTQGELAERAGISRTAVTAIEGQRLVPSVAVALALAKAFETSVEALFAPADEKSGTPQWAFEPPVSLKSFWEAEVGGNLWLYPASSSPMLTPPPDGRSRAAKTTESARSIARRTLVVACCDPAAGLLASEYARKTGLRMLVLHQSSRQALQQLQEGRVHAAGLHFSTPEEPERNQSVVRQTLGDGFQLLRMARWQEGIAAAAGVELRSVRAAVTGRLRWVGRESGSGARECLDRLIGEKRAPKRLARNHQGVVEAIRSGWADAGVCVQVTSSEAGLDFFPVQQEAYDLCIPDGLLDDPRIQSLIQVVRSAEYRQLLGELPGYDTKDSGSLAEVN